MDTILLESHPLTKLSAQRQHLVKGAKIYKEENGADAFAPSRS